MGWPSPWLAQAVTHVHVHMESRRWLISRQAVEFDLVPAMCCKGTGQQGIPVPRTWSRLGITHVLSCSGGTTTMLWLL